MIAFFCLFALSAVCGRTACAQPELPDSVAMQERRVQPGTVPHGHSAVAAGAASGQYRDSLKELAPITVVARGDSLPMNPSHTRILADDYRGLHYDLSSVLEGVAGVSVRRSGAIGHYSEASIRGSAPQNVTVLFDGLPLNSAYGGGVDLAKLPLGAIQRIDVYKGFKPLEFGGRSSGAVINVSSDPGYPVVSAGVETGSYGYRRRGGMLRSSANPAGHLVAIDHVHARNDYEFLYDNMTRYREDDDTVIVMDNNDFSSFSIAYANFWKPSERIKFVSRLWYDTFDEGLFSYLTSGRPQAARYHSDEVAVIEKIDLTASPRVVFSWETKGRFRKSIVDDPLAQLGAGGPKQFHEYFPMGETFLKAGVLPFDFVSLTALAGGRYEKWTGGQPVSTLPFPEPFFSRATLSGGAGCEFTVPDRLLVAAQYLGRYEIDETNSAGMNAFDTYDSNIEENRYNQHMEGTIIFRPGGFLEVFADGVRAARSPSLYEKYGKGSLFWGNADLEPELRMEFDAGLRARYKNNTTTLACYRGRTENLIKAVVNSQYLVRPLNYSDVRHWGVEWELNLRPIPMLTLGNSLTYSENYFFETAETAINRKKVPLQPDWTERLRLAVAFRKLSVGHVMTWVSPFFFDTPNEISNKEDEPRPLLDAYVRISDLLGLTLTYRIENYLDVRSADFRYAPKPGRMHFFVVNFSYSKNKEEML